MNNRLFHVKAILPGYSISDTYIVLATSEKQAEQQFEEGFPGSEIRSIELLPDNSILRHNGRAYSPLLGYQQNL